MAKTMKIISWIVTAGLVFFLIGLGLIYFLPGYNLYLVRSESMEPAIRMGDLIITGPVNGPISGDIKPGKIVTYQHGREMITHRVLSIEGTTVVMKGDALEHPDPWSVTLPNVQGIYLFQIPYLGFVLNFIRTKSGWFLAIIIPAALLVGWLIRDILKEAFSNA